MDTMAPSQDLGREHRTGGPRAGGRQGAGLLLPSREPAFLNRIPGPLQPHLGCCRTQANGSSSPEGATPPPTSEPSGPAPTSAGAWNVLPRAGLGLGGHGGVGSASTPCCLSDSRTPQGHPGSSKPSLQTPQGLPHVLPSRTPGSTPGLSFRSHCSPPQQTCLLHLQNTNRTSHLGMAPQLPAGLHPFRLPCQRSHWTLRLQGKPLAPRGLRPLPDIPRLRCPVPLSSGGLHSTVPGILGASHRCHLCVPSADLSVPHVPPQLLTLCSLDFLLTALARARPFPVEVSGSWPRPNAQNSARHPETRRGVGWIG